MTRAPAHRAHRRHRKRQEHGRATLHRARRPGDRRGRIVPLVVAPGQPGLAAVVTKFGKGVLTANGELDRRALRDLIFSDPTRAATSKPFFIRSFAPTWSGEPRRQPGLSSWQFHCWWKAAPAPPGSHSRGRCGAALQLQRLMARDSISLDQARAILAAQASRASRLKAADDVLINSGTVTQLRHAVDRLHERYLQLAENSYNASQRFNLKPRFTMALRVGSE